MNDTDVLLRARGVCKDYGNDEGLVRAVDDVDLDVVPGETLAIMGPSGCGKSTLLHLLGGLDRPDRGQVWLRGRRLDSMSERQLARMRRHSVASSSRPSISWRSSRRPRTSSCRRSWPGARPAPPGAVPWTCSTRSI